VQDLPFTNPLSARMVVYNSPLRHDTFKLMMYRVGHNNDITLPPSLLCRVRQGISTLFRRTVLPRTEPPRTLYTFHFSAPTADKSVGNWTFTSAVPSVPLRLLPELISYAGYAKGVTHIKHHLLNLRTRHPRTGLQHTAQGREASLEFFSNWKISPYSHAISGSSRTTRDYVISYYV
jgi:hypothetical protein